MSVYILYCIHTYVRSSEYMCFQFHCKQLNVDCGLYCVHRKSLRTSYILGFGSGFTDGMFFVFYAVVFRFGTFLITLDEDHFLHREFDDVYTYVVLRWYMYDCIKCFLFICICTVCSLL